MKVLQNEYFLCSCPTQDQIIGSVIDTQVLIIKKMEFFENI